MMEPDRTESPDDWEYLPDQAKIALLHEVLAAKDWPYSVCRGKGGQYTVAIYSPKGPKLYAGSNLAETFLNCYLTAIDPAEVESATVAEKAEEVVSA